MKETRNIRIDSLRTTMMVLIIGLHLSSIIFDIQATKAIHRDVFSSLLVSFRSLLFIGVSGFAFISGYYGIKFSLKKMIRYELMAVSMGCLNLILGVFVIKQISLTKALIFLTPFSSQVCWYLTAYFILMLVAPFINEGIKSLEKRHFQTIICILFISNYVFDFLHHRNGTTVLLLLVIYLFGQYLRTYPSSFLLKNNFAIFVGALVIQFALSFCGSYLGIEKISLLLENNHNPLLIFAVVGLFYNQKGKPQETKFHSFLAKLSPYIFAVYICHVELLSYLPSSYLNFFHSALLNYLFAIVLIFSFSLTLSFVREKCFSPLENYFINRWIK